MSTELQRRWTPALRGTRPFEAHALLDHGRVKVLWVKAGKLLPVDTGGRIRSFHLLSQLNARAPVTVLSYYGGARDHTYEQRLLECFPLAVPLHTGALDGTPAVQALDYARRIFWRAPHAVSKFTHPAVCRLVAGWDRARTFDVAVCDFLSASLNFPIQPRTPTVLFQHNVESMLWRRQAETERHAIKRLVFSREAGRMARYEREAVRRFHHVIAVSDADRQAMMTMTAPQRISVVPTGVDTQAFRPAVRAAGPPPVVLFLGSMDWEPNIDGVQHFCRDIWPAVRAAVPAARFQVVGRNPVASVRALASDSVEIVGTVPSVVEYLGQAAVVVVPLRVGGGTRLKIYEAMGAARAVVSSTVGAEGLDVTHGRDIVLADTPDAFAAAVVRLLTDASERRRLEDAALAVAARYDWSVIAERFEAILRTTVETARPSGDAGSTERVA